jgi:hypothetical protein
VIISKEIKLKLLNPYLIKILSKVVHKMGNHHIKLQTTDHNNKQIINRIIQNKKVVEVYNMVIIIINMRY